ncbi:hypothetical protein TWF694_004649 [Orbilia ellipsospora]|uniref:tripeptidyl-peptidase II n=1 Tax=Orbilia ellipsospora TaxID=2528407 RepID=A0AAV9WVS6_9PEZI
MRFPQYFLLLLNLFICIYANDVYQVFDSLDDLPDGWEELSTEVDPSTSLELEISLTKQNEAEFEENLINMSTPGHPSYGNFMEQSDIDAMLKPSEANFAAVENWLQSQGLKNSSFVIDEDSIAFNTTISQAESLLQTKYRVFRYNRTDVTAISALNYSLPLGVASAVELIDGVIDFPKISRTQKRRASQPAKRNPTPLKKRATTTTAEFCATITPSCLATVYNYQNYTPPAAPNNRIGIMSYLSDTGPETAQYSDLILYLQKYAPDKADRLFTCIKFPKHKGKCTQIADPDGTCEANNEDCPNEEANLDLQTAAGIVYPYETWFFDFGNLSYNKSFKRLLKRKNNNLPQVISSSWGGRERGRTIRTSRSICNKIMQLGARGRTVIVASGDNGFGDKCLHKGKYRFLPDVLASCPYITAVGGTKWDKTTQTEVTWKTSGGGFSNYFVRPKYQKQAVRNYLRGPGAADAANNAPYFNRSGRAYPDVAAFAKDASIFNDATEISLDGTSFAAPIFASLITLLNGIRLSEGKKPLGFLNPWLYNTVAPGGGFNDITVGRTIGCRASPKISAGFNAAPGWDPETGLGTPNFAVMRALMP